ncbi:hypothetical protein SLS62_006992 [Diatrype stigma]|uniref:Uncharacterized protein n=1 Tax=Diatrype stigma TaxID=117547 RepID=A0AAN9YQP4_9PEZI
MASTRAWTAQAQRELIESIVDCGRLDVPSVKFPLGRVWDWKAVEASMIGKGHSISLDALQAKWSREARGRLLQVKSSTNIQAGTDAAAVLITLSEKAYPQTPVTAPEATVAGPATQPAAPPANQTGAPNVLRTNNTKADFKRLTKEGREEVLASIRKELEILRDVMEEEDVMFDNKEITKEERVEALVLIVGKLEALRQVMKEEDGEEMVMAEMRNLAANI